MAKENKDKVNWTLDAEVIRLVEAEAQRLTATLGVTVSVSAAANKLLTDHFNQMRGAQQSEKK